MIHNEYLISEDDNENIWIEDYYSCMVAIYQKWQELKRNSDFSILHFMLCNFVEMFDMLEWLVDNEPEEEWRKLPLEARELRWHLARQEFAEMLSIVNQGISNMVETNFHDFCDADAYTKLINRTETDIFEAYQKNKPSDTKEWMKAYERKWQENRLEIDDSDYVCTKPMTLVSVLKESNKYTHQLFFLGIHAQCMINVSCIGASKKPWSVLLSREEWQELIRNTFVDYIKRNGRAIERELIKSANKHKKLTEERTPEVWAKVYEEEVAQLNEDVEDFKDSKFYSQPHTWVLDKLDDELFLPSAEENVSRLLATFGKDIKESFYSGLHNNNFETKIEHLCKEAHRMNIIKCGLYPELRTQYEAWIKGENKTDGLWQELREKMLGNIFYTDCTEELDEFIDFLRKQPKPTEITEQVRRLTQDKAISDKAYKKELHTLLHDADIYAPSYESWRQQVNI